MPASNLRGDVLATRSARQLLVGLLGATAATMAVPAVVSAIVLAVVAASIHRLCPDGQTTCSMTADLVSDTAYVGAATAAAVATVLLALAVIGLALGRSQHLARTATPDRDVDALALQETLQAALSADVQAHNEAVALEPAIEPAAEPGTPTGAVRYSAGGRVVLLRTLGELAEGDEVTITRDLGSGSGSDLGSARMYDYIVVGDNGVERLVRADEVAGA